MEFSTARLFYMEKSHSLSSRSCRLWQYACCEGDLKDLIFPYELKREFVVTSCLITWQTEVHLKYMNKWPHWYWNPETYCEGVVIAMPELHKEWGTKKGRLPKNRKFIMWLWMGNTILAQKLNIYFLLAANLYAVTQSEHFLASTISITQESSRWE